jgi:N-acetylmuramoyl-L-alanine amidase
MRDINKIILHCSATRAGDNSVNTEVIDKWHKARGWSGCGYHFVVLIDGTIEFGRMVEKIGAHTKNLNKSSIGVCYVGGVEQDGKTPKDTRTPEQVVSLLVLLRFLKKSFPDASIHGHNEFSNKACPSFDVNLEYGNL